jgi:hypothetical protein
MGFASACKVAPWYKTWVLPQPVKLRPGTKHGFCLSL